MRGVLLFLLVLVVCSSVVMAADPQAYSSLTIDGSLTNSFSISASGPHPSVSSLTANISWFPSDREGQRVVFFTTVPEAQERDGVLVFSERHLPLGDHSYDVEYRVVTSTDQVLVHDRIPFPLAPLSGDLVPYVQPTQTIDFNDDIRSLASSLAEGEDDLFVLVTKVAGWTKRNINYDLSTINVEASQPSSYVLETREGVCDEITNLFISLLRSLGVPARFVSGVAYTSSELFDQPWGAHGWAEVYFPGDGWVPFDVTYGQYGWVDASHVVFNVGVDSGKYASSYSWLAHDVDVDIGGMGILASAVDEGPSLDPFLDLSIRPLEDDVGIGSYELVLVEATNPTDHYVADSLQLALVDGYDLLDPAEQSVVLAPGASTTLSWRVLVDDSLSDHYIYTYPLVVLSHRGARAQGEFYVKPRAQSLSRSWVDRYAEGLSSGVAKPYDPSVSFSCAPQQSLTPRAGERVSFRCAVRNDGDLDLRGLKVCLSSVECSSLDVPAGAEGSVVLGRVFDDPSLYALSFTANNSLVGKRSFVSVQVVAPPDVAIVNLSAPSSIDFSDEGAVRFSVVQQGGLPASDVVVSLRGPRLQKSWSFDKLSGEKRFDIAVAGDALSLRDDSFLISVSYRDERGSKVSVERPFSISLGEVSWWQRVVLWLMSL